MFLPAPLKIVMEKAIGVLGEKGIRIWVSKLRASPFGFFGGTILSNILFVLSAFSAVRNPG